MTLDIKSAIRDLTFIIGGGDQVEIPRYLENFPTFMDHPLKKY